MPRKTLCPECGGPLKESKHSEAFNCTLCNAEIAVRDIFEGDSAPECPACNGPGLLLSSLGKLTNYRCRNCGADFSIKEKKGS